MLSVCLSVRPSVRLSVPCLHLEKKQKGQVKSYYWGRNGELYVAVDFVIGTAAGILIPAVKGTGCR